MSHPFVMMAAMFTITVTEPVVTTSAVVVVDPGDAGLVHAHGGCAELSTVVDLVERATGAPVDDPDAFDAALVDLGLALPLSGAIGLRPCPSCWGA